MTTDVVDEKTPQSVSVVKNRRTDEDEPVQRCATDAVSLETSVVISSTSSSSIVEARRRADAVPTEKELAQQQESMKLQALARQLEYYFSKQNLANDTYLQTLRELNDGCVPVTILANFCKVKAILTNGAEHKKSAATLLQEEELRMHAILQAVNEYYTDVLQVHSIDTATGKIATDDTPSSAITILAVGPVPNYCEELPTVLAPPQQQRAAADSNTIVLRDVQPVVTELEVRRLLDEIEGCPRVVSIVSDVANCWFITLDTSDRCKMMQIMMQLRTKTFPSSGDYVMARLRASIVSHASVDVYSILPTAAVQQMPRKKKKKKRSRSKKNKSAPEATTSTADKNNATKLMPPPPALTEDHFPALQDPKVEWATTPVEADDSIEEEDDASDESNKHGEDEEERKSAKALSDAASTATTTSSNASSGFDSISKKQEVGGYAAALLMAPTTTAKPSTIPAVREATRTELTNPGNPASDSNEKVAPDPVVITSPPTWGGGRSFADILRKSDKQQREKEKQ